MSLTSSTNSSLKEKQTESLRKNLGKKENPETPIKITMVEVSTNGRDSIIMVMDTEYCVKIKDLQLVRRILMNSFSEELEEDIYIYLHHKELTKN